MARVFDNDFRQWKITPEQISRIKNGEVQAMTEVFTDNYDRIKGMAYKYYLGFRDSGCYGLFEPEDLINQVFADMPYYRYDNALTMFMDIKYSFWGVDSGGIRANRRSIKRCLSLDVPIEEGNDETFGDLLPDTSPDVLDTLIREEDEINSMEVIFNTVKKTFNKLQITEKQKEIYTLYAIEMIFRNYTYEAVKHYVFHKN